MVAEIEDRADTSFVDGELAGNTEYFYQVVVMTERGEEIYSEETSGIFHPLLATWSLDEMLEDIRPNQLFVRLYAEPGERIVALILGEERANGGGQRREGAQVLVLDRQGQLVEQQILLEDSPNFLPRRSAVMALGSGGRRFLGLTPGGSIVDVQGRIAGILAFGTDGKPVVREWELFPGSFPDALSDAQAVVLGEIALQSPERAVLYDNVEVYQEDRLFFTEFLWTSTRQV